eukprot:596255-Alexandrium_andersonii.AAC.1
MCGELVQTQLAFATPKLPFTDPGQWNLTKTPSTPQDAQRISNYGPQSMTKQHAYQRSAHFQAGPLTHLHDSAHRGD